MKRLLVSLLPWATFDMLLRSAGLDVAWGAAIALLATIALLLLHGELRAPRGFELASLVTFGSLLVAALVDHGGDPFRLDARAIAAGGLGLVSLGSVTIRPCTTRYVRDVTAPRHWATREFSAFNRRFSAAWAMAFLAIAGGYLLGAHLLSPMATTVFNWLLPLGLLFSLGGWMAASLDRTFEWDEPTLAELAATFDAARIERARRPSERGFLRLYQEHPRP